MKRYTFYILVALVLPSMCITASHASATGNHCHFTAYTADYDGRHFSLLKNNSTLVGTTFVIETNCLLQFSYDNGAVFEINSNYSQPIPLSTSSITITQNNMTHIYQSLTIFPASEIYYGTIPDEPSSSKTDNEVWMGEIVAHGTTFIIVYLLSTTVIYQVARKRVDDSISVVV